MSDETYNLNGGFKPTMKRFADLNGPDFFPTPPWATFALIENEKFSGEIWECACGDGTMSRVLAETGQPVRSTDLYDRGFGESGVDFLTSQSRADNIVTNPPYNCAEQFVASGRPATLGHRVNHLARAKTPHPSNINRIARRMTRPGLNRVDPGHIRHRLDADHHGRRARKARTLTARSASSRYMAA
jgi:hypothetical protein